MCAGLVREQHALQLPLPTVWLHHGLPPRLTVYKKPDKACAGRDK